MRAQRRVDGSANPDKQAFMRVGEEIDLQPIVRMPLVRVQVGEATRLVAREAAGP